MRVLFLMRQFNYYIYYSKFHSYIFQNLSPLILLARCFIKNKIYKLLYLIIFKILIVFYQIFSHYSDSSCMNSTKVCVFKKSN